MSVCERVCSDSARSLPIAMHQTLERNEEGLNDGGPNARQFHYVDEDS